MDATIRLLLADAHTLLRSALAEFLDRQPRFAVVGQTASTVQVVQLALDRQPNVVISDVRLADGSGIEATGQIRARLPQVEVLILTASEDKEDLLDALGAGAKVYLLKNVEAAQLVQAIETVHEGGLIISPGVARHLLRELAGSALSPLRAAATGVEPTEVALTAREWEIFNLIREGKSNREIRQALSISESTVKSHLHRVLSKLHLASRTQVAIYAERLNHAL